MGAFGDIISAFEGDPTFKVLDYTKSKALQAKLDQLLTDYSSAKSQGQSAIDEFINRFQQSSPEVNKEGQQEIGNIDRYFNGDVGNTLANLRANRAAAVKAAGDRSLALAQKSRNLSQLTSGGGSSSYLQRLGLKNATDINVNEALDQSNQERGDFGWLEGQKQALTGRRSAIQDALTNRILTPSRTQQAFNASNLGYLQGWQQVNNANKFYGLQQERTVADRVGQGLDGALQLVLDYYTGGQAKNPSSVNQSPQGLSTGGGGGGYSYGNQGWGSSGNFAPNQTSDPNAPGYVTQLPQTGTQSGFDANSGGREEAAGLFGGFGE